MLIMNIDNFSLNAKNKVFNNDGKLLYWSQPDFAYKNRLHVYDDSDAEIGYIQYKILSSQKENEVYDADDKRIDVSSFSIIENKNCSCKINYEGKEMITIKRIDNMLTINVMKTEMCNLCILYVFSILN